MQPQVPDDRLGEDSGNRGGVDLLEVHDTYRVNPHGRRMAIFVTKLATRVVGPL